MIVPKELRKGEVITSPAELRKIANKIMQERLNMEVPTKDDKIKFVLPIKNKRGYHDTWNIDWD